MEPATNVVAEIVRGITPYDSLERRHIDETLAWLSSTNDIFRRVKPATPSPHLVAYVVLIDPEGGAVYLGRHRKAGLWLPTGGHVDPGEHPTAAARREATEELGITPEFSVTGVDPLMLTVTTTLGDDPHVDISLWYTIRGNRAREYTLDADEFDGGRWWDIDHHAIPESDPHFGRFLAKLDTALHAARRR